MTVHTFKIKICDYLNMVHAFNNENWESIDFLSHQTNTYYHTLFDIPKNHEIVPHQKKVSLRQVFSAINIEPPNMFFAPNRYCGLEAHTNVSNFDFHLFSLYSAYSWFNEYEFFETFEWSLPVVFDFTGTHQNVQLNGGTRTRFEQFQNTITKVHVVSDGIHNKDKVERLLRLLRDNNGIEMRAKHNTVDLTSSIMHSGHVSGNLISFASKHRLKEELKLRQKSQSFSINCNLLFKFSKNRILSIESDGIIENIATIDNGKIMFIKNNKIQFKQDNMFFTN